MQRRYEMWRVAAAMTLVPSCAIAQTTVGGAATSTPPSVASPPPVPTVPTPAAPPPASAQPTAGTTATATAPTATAQTDPQPLCTGCVLIPALTPVRIELLSPQGSKISKSGDLFAIRLAEPIIVDGQVVVPAGVTGMGEVIHAKRAGGSGAPGELILAARYLDLGTVRLRLRSLDMTSIGKSKYGTSDTLAVASAAGGVGLSVLALAITGKESKIEAGSVASAKTAEPIALVPGSIVVPEAAEPPAAAPPAAAPDTPAATPAAAAGSTTKGNDQ